MMNTQPDGLTKWYRFVSEKDIQALAEALADDVLFRSPVLWKPEVGESVRPSSGPPGPDRSSGNARNPTQR